MAQSILVTPASGPLEQNATRYLQTSQASTGLVSITTLPSGSAGRFRFMVYLVKRAPESRAARFAIGDTVSGETIDPIVDFDEFVASGTAGQEVVAVLQAQGPPGSGAVALTVFDPVTNQLLGLASHDPTGPVPPTTGRFTFPVTRDYTFSFSSLIGNFPFPRYQGPYRFWTYAIDRRPEHHAVVVAVDSEVQGESIDRAGDVDEFEFLGDAGTEMNAFLQSTLPLQLEVNSAAGLLAGLTTGGGPDTTLFHAATGRFRINLTGPTVVRVMGLNAYTLADTGAFRFFLYPIDRRPESIGAAINPNDTISGESIDRPGDVDEFTFTTATGGEFNAFLQAQNGSSQSVLQLDVLDDTGAVVKSAQSHGTDNTLARQQTGRFNLLTGGTHRLRVSGVVSTTDRDTGSFRLLVYPINRQPETVPDSIVLGDSVLTEAIDAPGDVDEYRVIVSDTSGANLVARIDPGAIGSVIEVKLMDGAGQTVAIVGPNAPGDFGQSGPVLLPPGVYTLRVQGQSVFGDERADLVGGYEVWLYRFRFGPESTPDTIAIGDTISTETIDPPGDVDDFWFSGKRGDHVNLALEGQAGPTSGGLSAFLLSPSTSFLSIVGSPTQPDSLGAHESGRIDLPVDGVYQIRVGGGSSPAQLFERGPYRFALTRRSTAPEHVSAALAPGDSVIGEVVDTPDDWDEFTVTGTPGQLLTIIGRTIDASPPGFPLITVFDSTTTDTVAWTALQGFDKPTGSFTLPESGRLKIAVYHPAVGFGGVFLGGYRFLVVAVNPAPESVPAALTLDDTVSGESLFPAMDVDEFTGTGVPGDTLVADFRLLADPVPPGLITLEVEDPATGTILTPQGFSAIAATPQFVGPGFFVVPASGSYVVRMLGGGFGTDQLGTAPYELRVRRWQ